MLRAARAHIQSTASGLACSACCAVLRCCAPLPLPPTHRAVFTPTPPLPTPAAPSTAPAPTAGLWQSYTLPTQMLSRTNFLRIVADWPLGTGNTLFVGLRALTTNTYDNISDPTFGGQWVGASLGPLGRWVRFNFVVADSCPLGLSLKIIITTGRSVTTPVRPDAPCTAALCTAWSTSSCVLLGSCGRNAGRRVTCLPVLCTPPCHVPHGPYPVPCRAGVVNIHRYNGASQTDWEYSYWEGSLAVAGSSFIDLDR